MKRFSVGCLCGALRYEVAGEPLYAGHCYSVDCRKASGSGFIPFLGVARSDVRFSGQILEYRSKAAMAGMRFAPWALIPPGLKIFEDSPR